ncbi:hypothetical protein C8K63_102111 [Pseudomonas sp. GV085]|nr:hypothetical protein C8K63_102111 [Pseudomonas sp. GV085]
MAEEMRISSAIFKRGRRLPPLSTTDFKGPDRFRSKAGPGMQKLNDSNGSVGDSRGSRQ